MLHNFHIYCEERVCNLTPILILDLLLYTARRTIWRDYLSRFLSFFYHSGLARYHNFFGCSTRHKTLVFPFEYLFYLLFFPSQLFSTELILNGNDTDGRYRSGSSNARDFKTSTVLVILFRADNWYTIAKRQHCTCKQHAITNREQHKLKSNGTKPLKN